MRRQPVEARVLTELKTGFRYVMASDPIRTALLLLAIVSAMGMPYTVLMPVIVSTVLHGGPSTLGLLMTASGLGALGGALYLASRESVVGLGRVSTISTIAFGAGLIAFASTRSEVVALLVLPIVGAGLMVQMGSINTILQTIVEDHLRGRVMAFYTMAFFGSAPIGSLLAGVAADRIGAGWTIAVLRGCVRGRRAVVRAPAANAAGPGAADLHRSRHSAGPRGRQRRQDTLTRGRQRATDRAVVTSRCRDEGRTPSSSLPPTTSAPRARADRDGPAACRAHSRSR